MNNLKNIKLPSQLQKLDNSLLKEKNISLSIKRDDLIHEHISGNKWRKLKYNLLHAVNEKKAGIITFGGAFSNHLIATAFAANASGLKSVGVVRGEDADENNPTLIFCRENGMIIKKITREEYKAKEEDGFLKLLHHEFENHFVVPEGGANFYGMNGCLEIVNEIEEDFDFITTSCGTGTTLAGIIAGLKENQKAIGFSALKGGDFFQEEIEKQLYYFSFDKEWVNDIKNKFRIETNYHFGGYAKTNTELFDFINWFEKEFKILLDPVYTGKMMFGLFDLIKKDYFKSGAKIIAVHTGGLQGWGGMRL